MERARTSTPAAGEDVGEGVGVAGGEVGEGVGEVGEVAGVTEAG